MAAYSDYLTAAALLWGPAGEFACAEAGRLNREHFAGSIPPLPIVIGLTAYGKCIAATLSGPEWLESPRITLAPGIFNHGGTLMVSDVLVHELIHAALRLRGEEAGHNEAPWCRMVTELSLAVLGQDVNAEPVKPRRVPNPARAADQAAPKTIVVRRAEPGALTQAQLATWPHSVRPAGYYDAGKPIPVPTY